MASFSYQQPPSLLSTVHGRDRRASRNIEKKNLNFIVANGVRTRARNDKNGNARFKFVLANTVCITDASCTREITSYVLPLEIEKVIISQADVTLHHKWQNELNNHPQICTSHTVIIVDQSGSMKKRDVEGYLDRSNAVYSCIALDFVGKLLDSNQAKLTDAISLVEMNDTASIIFSREPQSNVLFNKILDRKATAVPKSHGNYLPALQAAEALFRQDKLHNPSCSLLLLFLSDGKPSDPQENITGWVSSIARQHTSRLTVGMVGFGDGKGDFSMLQHMVLMAKASGAQASYQYSKACGGELSSVLSSLGSSLVESRTQLSRFSDSRRSTERLIEKEDLAPPMREGTHIFEARGWKVHENNVYRADWRHEKWNYLPLQDPRATGIAYREKSFSRGAERVVYQLTEVVRLGHYSCVSCGDSYVAKEPLFQEDMIDRSKFFSTFCKIHSKAARYADSFNLKVASVMNNRMGKFGKIEFLDCFVYEVYNSNHTEVIDFVLAEKMIDHSKFIKWNSNNGYVNGESREDLNLAGLLNLSASFEALSFRNTNMLAVLEEDEEDEEEDSDSDDGGFRNVGATSTRGSGYVRDGSGNVATVKLSDVPQCFSHYTYHESNRSMLVCDLQGVLDETKQPPLFQLTDPVIHSAGQKKKYGRTDSGSPGIMTFFLSHKCNELCRLMGLPDDAKV